MAKRTIRDEITIAAPRERVFRALTEADALEHWMASAVESDARTGGRFRYAFEFDDASQNNVQEGEYLAVEDGRRIALPWSFPFSDKRTTVEYVLSSRGDETSVEFSHAGFDEGEPWDGAYERFTGGWRLFLESLKSYVDTGAASLPLGIKSRAA